MISAWAYADGKQSWLERVAYALKDEREEIVKRYLATPTNEQDTAQLSAELRAIDQRLEENRRELTEHRKLMILVRDADVRSQQRAGWP